MTPCQGNVYAGSLAVTPCQGNVYGPFLIFDLRLAGGNGCVGGVRENGERVVLQVFRCSVGQRERVKVAKNEGSNCSGAQCWKGTGGNREKPVLEVFRCSVAGDGRWACVKMTKKWGSKRDTVPRQCLQGELRVEG